MIAFVKRLDDGGVLYMEEVRTGRNELAATSMRKYPATMNVDAVAATFDLHVQDDGRRTARIISPSRSRVKVRPAQL